MASPNFPSTGLVADVTTFQVGDINYLWDGEKWKSITGPLSHGLLSNRDAADSHPISAISGVADRLALSGNAVFESTADLLTGTSRDGVISDATFQALVGTTTQCKTDGFYAGSTSGSANYTFLNEVDSTAAGYVTGYSRFQVKGLNVYACLDSMAEVYITQFGAVVGVDSTSNIQAAIDFANVSGCGLVRLDGHTYDYTRLIPRSHVIIRGTGSGDSFLRCTDSTTLDSGVSFGSSIRKLDDGTRVSRFGLQDLGIISNDTQLAFKDILAVNLCACERGDHRNVFIGGFGYGGFTLARAEAGAEGLGFTNTTQDGNYHTFSQITCANTGEFNPDNASLFWLLFKANSNNFYGVYQKGNVDILMVIKNGNDNSVFGGASESAQSIISIDGELVRSNQFIGIRGEGISGSAYNILNGASDNLIIPGRMTGIGGSNFNIDSASENLNRIIGAEVNTLRSETFPPASDWANDHNRGALQITSVNGSPDYPLYVKSEKAEDPTSPPWITLFNDLTSPTTAQVLGHIGFYNRDVSSNAAGENGFIEGVIENSTGGTALVFSTGASNASVTEQVRIDRLGNLLAENDNTQTLGGSSNRWSEIFAGNGTINTSDEREKTELLDIEDAEKRVAVKLKSLIKKYKFKDSVERKGDDARIHFGIGAQSVISAFESEGLDPFSYSMVCKDEWDDIYKPIYELVEKTDEEGNVFTRRKPTGDKILVHRAGYRYGIRYEQLLAFIISAI